MRSTSLFVGLGALASAAAALSAGACGGDTSGTGGAEPVCSVEAQTGCGNGTRCEEVEGGEAACFAPLVVEGRVSDLLDDSSVSGALVIALDETGTALSTSAATDTDGHYELRIPAKRDADGKPLPLPFSLRVDASRYVSFPRTPRLAPSLDVTDAVTDGTGGGGPSVGWTLASEDTDVALLPLADTDGLGSVSGIVKGDDAAGTLVLAGGSTGVADRDGDFIVFNVPAGEVNVSGYRMGANFGTGTISVDPNKEAAGVVLERTGDASAVVTGSTDLVDGASKEVDVELALEGSFDDARVAGEAPPGLRTTTQAGAYTFQGVPDGIYVVLASVANDGLVHDADTSAGGAPLARVTVAGGDADVATPLRLKSAIAIVSPGANGVDVASGTPKLSWKDDASEDGYHVEVFDLRGGLLWETTGDFGPGDAGTASVDYAGPPLDPGVLYQFFVTSSSGPTPLTKSEDLRGVFRYQ
ncbi:MAG TPA: hypothetical protein VL400_03780 [Polyangiaceae bacterium]|nr:hypothetical protein [Polyangiaceae bacterium]